MEDSSQSRLTKLLESDVFKSQDGNIDVEKLILFGYLNCAGDVRNKSQVLYRMFQKGDGYYKNSLSASDKEIEPTIRKIIHLCTTDLAKLMSEVDGTCSPINFDGKRDHIDKVVEDIVELNYLDPLYGNKGKLTYEQFVDLSEYKPSISSIWYDPQYIRMLTLYRAGMQVNDHQDLDVFAENCRWY